MDAQENDLSNEAAALADILKWSVDLPVWQRDALRRLCGQSKLETADITALVAVCKGTDKGSPFDATHVRDPAASHAVVSLGALHGLSHVNALAPGERLTFGKSGLTVIYGDNGAGKSGYARVLKQLCRARSPKGDAILPNIYAAGSGTSPTTIPIAKLPSRPPMHSIRPCGRRSLRAPWSPSSSARSNSRSTRRCRPSSACKMKKG